MSNNELIKTSYIYFFAPSRSLIVGLFLTEQIKNYLLVSAQWKGKVIYSYDRDKYFCDSCKNTDLASLPFGTHQHTNLVHDVIKKSDNLILESYGTRNKYSVVEFSTRRVVDSSHLLAPDLLCCAFGIVRVTFSDYLYKCFLTLPRSIFFDLESYPEGSELFWNRFNLKRFKAHNIAKKLTPEFIRSRD